MVAKNIQDSQETWNDVWNYLNIIQKQIVFPRVKILKVLEDHYVIRYGKEEMIVKKSNESFYASSWTNQITCGVKLALRHTLEILPLEWIFLDENAPQEFMEVIIFHEIRENFYREMNLENPHEQAVHDEILYAMKHLSIDQQQSYFVWAKNVRNQALKKKWEAKRKMKSDEKKEPKKQDKMQSEIDKKKQETLEKRQKFLAQLGYVALDDSWINWWKKEMWLHPIRIKIGETGSPFSISRGQDIAYPFPEDWIELQKTYEEWSQKIIPWLSILKKYWFEFSSSLHDYLLKINDVEINLWTNPYDICISVEWLNKEDMKNILSQNIGYKQTYEESTRISLSFPLGNFSITSWGKQKLNKICKNTIAYLQSK